MHGMGHPDPEECAKFCSKLLPKDGLVMDFGCGTGIMGEELAKIGVNQNQVWGIDAS